MAIGEQEVIGPVGAPVSQQTQCTVVEPLWDLHQSAEPPSIASPHEHIQTLAIHHCAAAHRGTAHRKALLIYMHHSCQNNREHLIQSKTGAASEIPTIGCMSELTVFIKHLLKCQDDVLFPARF